MRAGHLFNAAAKRCERAKVSGIPGMKSVRRLALWPKLLFHASPGMLFGYAFVFGLLFVLLLWPLTMLAIGAFLSTSPLQSGGTWTTAAFVRMWEEINTSNALVNSCLYAVATTAIAVTLAALLAFLAERTNTPFRRLITPLVMVCATTSTVFYAIGYSLLANGHNGVVNVFYFYLTGERQPLVNIESWGGLIFVDSLHLAAFLYLFLLGPLRTFDRSHEEAALAAGASRLWTLWTINVRLLTPILTSVVLIGLVLGLKSFNIPLILGGHANCLS
jgi:iron(III) transport system permease protein